MAKIDPMYNLMNTILDDKEVVIFLGAGASLEGTQDGNPFPSFDKMIDNILKNWGFALAKKKKRFENFLTVINKWEKERKLSIRLNKYLDGEPGPAHYYLAALSIALFGESNALLYLTTNYDDLMKKAFTDLERNPVNKFNSVVLPLRPRIVGSEFQEIVSNIEVHSKSGQPVILKLFGDLNSQSPIFRQEDMIFEPVVEDQLIEWMKKPMIVIGYSFSDRIIEELLISARGTSPTFLVNPSLKKIPPSVKNLERVYHINKTFSEFILDLLQIIKEKNPSIIKKTDKILDFLKPLKERLYSQSMKDKFIPGDSFKTKHKKEKIDKDDKIVKIYEKEKSHIQFVEHQDQISSVKKILILSANPKTTPSKRFDEEIRDIEEGLQNAKHKDRFEIKSRLAVRLTDLRNVLLNYEPQIVHFIGHGIRNGLLFEDEFGMAVRISAKALSGLFELCSTRVECAVLNAAYSASLAKAICKHINYVIGIRKEIKDEAAIEFVVGFYDALGAGRSVEEAFEFGRNAIMQISSNLSAHLILFSNKREYLEKKESNEIRGEKEKGMTEMDANKSEQSSKKILILSANPKATPRLRLDEEIRGIEEGLRYAKHGSLFEIRSRLATRFRDLRRELLNYGPHIVHFSGHGNKDGLFLEDKLGMAVPVNSKTLSGLFKLCSTRVECVILSTICSASLASAINKHINYVIGVRKEIEDAAAIEFAVGFYDALGAGRTVLEAFKFGLNAILLAFPEHPGHLSLFVKMRKDLEKEESNGISGESEKYITKMDANKLERSSKKILILSANPKATDHLLINEEIRKIKKGLFHTKCNLKN